MLAKDKGNINSIVDKGDFQVGHWLRIPLPMQEARVQSLDREDFICHGTTKLVCHDYWSPHFRTSAP